MSDNPTGETAGTIGPHGYLWIEIDGVNYTAQDLAWMLTHGELPDGALVDFIPRLAAADRRTPTPARRV
jgi:hypothetical protein